MHGIVVGASGLGDGLNELGIEIDKKKILLEEPIKSLGESMVAVKVGYQMTAEFKVKIVALPVE